MWILFSSGLLDNRNVFLTPCDSANCFNLYLLSTGPLSDPRKGNFDMQRLPVFLQYLLAELEEGKYLPETTRTSTSFQAQLCWSRAVGSRHLAFTGLVHTQEALTNIR